MPHPLEIQDFGYGLMTKLSPTQQPPGAALVSLDCDYNTRNVMNRKGYVAVLENGPGALKIADFEPAEAWVGGTADVINFVLTEAAADGSTGRSLSATGGGAEIAMTLAVALNLGSDALDVIHCFLMSVAQPATVTGYALTLRFQTSANNYYQATIASDQDLKNLLELNLSKYARLRRQDFAATGSPDWTNITLIRFGLTAVGSGTLTVTVDNLHRTPGLMQDLFQFKRETGAFAGASEFFAVTGGVLYKSDGRRWVQVFSGFDVSAPVQSISAQDRRLMTDGVTSPRLLMPDGSTVYRFGIATPPKTMIGTQLAGGGLPDGAYFAQVAFYSSKTGFFSAPDDKNPSVPILTISGGGGTAGIRLSNIPVSTDPQVDWVIIGIRPSTEPVTFFRISDGLYGDVPNGTTVAEFSGTLTTLLARSLTAIDPDMDYPAVIDPTTKRPVEGHPLFFAEAGGYIISVMAEQPTVVRASRFRNPGSWALDDEFPLGENDQEPLTGIAVSGSHVIAMKRDAVYPGRVIGEPDKLIFDPPISDRGAVSHKGMAVIGHQLFYRALDGMYLLPQDLVPRKISDLAQPTWKALWDPYGVGKEAAVPIRDGEQVVLFGRSLGAARSDIGWVTHYRTVAVAPGQQGRFPSWAPTLWRIPADVAAETRPQLSDGSGWETWIGGLGQVFRLNYGQQDDGRPIDFVHRTPYLTPAAALTHLFRYVDVEGFCSGNFSLDVRILLGTAIQQDGAPTALLQGNAAVLGPFKLGTDRLGAPAYIHQRVNLPVRAARYISLEFHGRARTHVELYRVRPWHAPLGSRRVAA